MDSLGGASSLQHELFCQRCDRRVRRSAHGPCLWHTVSGRHVLLSGLAFPRPRVFQSGQPRVAGHECIAAFQRGSARPPDLWRCLDLPRARAAPNGWLRADAPGTQSATRPSVPRSSHTLVTTGADRPLLRAQDMEQLARTVRIDIRAEIGGEWVPFTEQSATACEVWLPHADTHSPHASTTSQHGHPQPAAALARCEPTMTCTHVHTPSRPVSTQLYP